MGRDISYETYRRGQKKLRTISELSKKFQKFGYRYSGVYPNILGRKPVLMKDKKPYKAIRHLGIREARALLKRLGAEKKKKGKRKRR